MIFPEGMENLSILIFNFELLNISPSCISHEIFIYLNSSLFFTAKSMGTLNKSD
jgi:hypothetical protein